jgi:NTE family protein
MDHRGKDFALCLSGGGFRAALFHLGGLRRLNEHGILSQVDVVSAVSGGSMLAAHLAIHMQMTARQGIPWPESGGVWPAFDAMASTFHAKVAKHLPIASTLSFSEVIMRKLPRGFKKWVGDMKLMELPTRPDFIFNATELQTGRLWSFSRTSVGSDELGYSQKYGHALVAEAVIASASFPAFEQLHARFRGADFEGGAAANPQADWEILLADGGIFDNVGLEKVGNAGTVLVSNGGRDARPLPNVTGSDSPEEPIAMEAPATNQFEALRWILGSRSRDPTAARLRLERLSRRLSGKEVEGAYWSIGNGIDTGQSGLTEGYTQELAAAFIASIRTQLDAFSDAERHVLENHGYLMADAAIRIQAPGLIRNDRRLAAPWPDALSPDYVKKYLQDSDSISSGWRTLKRLFRR